MTATSLETTPHEVRHRPRHCLFLSSQSIDIVNTARMLAMVHVASAEATVGCFDAKYSFLFWRPVHAIQRADTDDNPRTAPDVTWNALLNVNHPEYPSAHSCWTQAVTDTLAYFFGATPLPTCNAAAVQHQRLRHRPR
jgi:hypothetical protein